jgi:GH15 family glucan-1,4-alpha-glucosidase
MLLLNELGFLTPDHPRFLATIKAIESELKQGDFIFRYVEKDDFGEPENAFVVCTFWYIYALAAVGRKNEARRLFEHMLAHRNQYGMLPEHIDPRTGEHWGNYPQTYSMVGIITSAIRLSIAWDEAV